MKGKYFFNKKIRWANVGYQYDWNNRCYPKIENFKLPEHLENLCKRTKTFSSKYFGKFDKYKAESVIINFYDKKDSMGGHLDDGEIDQESPIFSYNFGLSCVFLIGGTTKEIKPLAIKLDSGNIFYLKFNFFKIISSSKLIY